MPHPLDMLIGPALRSPQGPREGEASESRRPYSPAVGVAGSVAAALAVGWAFRTLMRRRAGT